MTNLLKQNCWWEFPEWTKTKRVSGNWRVIPPEVCKACESILACQTREKGKVPPKYIRKYPSERKKVLKEIEKALKLWRDTHGL